jgi:hypothetical protein
MQSVITVNLTIFSIMVIFELFIGSPIKVLLFFNLKD